VLYKANLKFSHYTLCAPYLWWYLSWQKCLGTWFLLPRFWNPEGSGFQDLLTMCHFALLPHFCILYWIITIGYASGVSTCYQCTCIHILPCTFR
jgi:hypothetical protein